MELIYILVFNYMANITKYPGTSANDSSIGITDWYNTNNIIGNTTSRAGVGLLSGDISKYLKALNYGFSIPINSTIDGIKVEVEKDGNVDYSQDNSVRIVKGGSITGDDKANTDAWKGPFQQEYVAYGGETDLWGETWTANDINNSDFGLVFSCKNTSASTFFHSAVYNIRITVYYTESSTITGVQSITGINTITF